MNNIVVVGGGTAGWITALFIRKKLNQENVRVTLIESSDIGILGAGEGTTPHMVGFLQEVGLSVFDVIAHCKGTFKNGIKFTNWCGDNTHYFHPFEDSDSNIKLDFICHQVLCDKNIDDIIISSEVSMQNKVKYKPSSKIRDVEDETIGNYSVHFDARLLADYLRKVGMSRGITVVDSKVQKINNDKEGYITSLELENEDIIYSDFVFDCTGFKRLIIGEHYQTEWVSYKETIPNDRAIPFFIANDTEVIPPYTEAIAMKCGWVWKIPVQGRFGCGYVFDSSHISDEQAKQEIVEKFGEVKFINEKGFNFKAGCYKDVWVKNCIAVGLSSGFIEPLEATSIWMAINTLNEIEKYKQGLICRDEIYIEKFNKFIYNMNEQILAFIYLHYITPRNDTPYWANFRSKNKAPESYIKFEKLALEGFLPFELNEVWPNTFGYVSNSAVGAGVKIFNKTPCQKLIEYYKHVYGASMEKIKDSILAEKTVAHRAANLCLDHFKYIESIKKNYESRNQNTTLG